MARSKISRQQLLQNSTDSIMSISAQTQICWHSTILQFGPVLGQDAQPIPELAESSPCAAMPPNDVAGPFWLRYSGVQPYLYLDKPSMNVVATRIDVYLSNHRDEASEGEADTPQYAGSLGWRTLCASPSPHELRYEGENPIGVICDASANRYIENVLIALRKGAKGMSETPTAGKHGPQFYIVRPFVVRHNFDFETIDGSLADLTVAVYGSPVYIRPHARSTVREIVYLPDGTVLIPDEMLGHLRDEAECAALLSFALVNADQSISAHLFDVQHFKAHKMSFDSRKNGTNNAQYTGRFIWNLNEQVLRLGIRTLCLAGYDLRQVPFAWASMQGERGRDDSNVSSDRHMPWYATYASNAINQLYPNADYSKLKRGELEYQQFLSELRKADPEAFGKGGSRGK